MDEERIYNIVCGVMIIVAIIVTICYFIFK